LLLYVARRCSTSGVSTYRNTSCLFLCSWAVAWRSHRLAGLALLLFLPAHATAQTAIDWQNVKTAVAAWVTNPVTAATTYGPIADWNTAELIFLNEVFMNRPTFNDDISKWNVARVFDMTDVR
jgi:hypothetical protein